jgi:hypothetical protein
MKSGLKARLHQHHRRQEADFRHHLALLPDRGPEGNRPCLDRLKQLGFREATRSGCSIGITDMVIPIPRPPVLRTPTSRSMKSRSSTAAVSSPMVSAIRRSSTSGPRSVKSSPTSSSAPWSTTRARSITTRSTSWSTRAPEATARRSSSSPACAASWPSPPVRSSNVRSPRTSAKVSACSSTSSPPTVPVKVWQTPL